MPEPETKQAGALAYFPVTIFATVMGLGGLALALQMAETIYGWPHWASRTALGLAILDFSVLSVIYLFKAFRHPEAVAAEWRHPLKLSFFPAISISMVLIATALKTDMSGVARGLWIVGTLAQGGLTLAVISGWIGQRPFELAQVSPAWFIPAVGNAAVPVAGMTFGFVELSWLFFSLGIVFWLVLLTLVMNRLIFHAPMPARLLPTLVILVAPPALACLAWLQLNGGVLDPLARVLYYASAFFAALVVVQAPRFVRLPFALSWWALSFPVAALTMATYRYAELSGHHFHGLAAAVLLGVLTAILAALLWRTARAALQGDICLPD